MKVRSRFLFDLYLRIQSAWFPLINDQEFRQLIADHQLLEKDHHGEKVLQSNQQQIIKIFRLKRLFSSAYFFPYAYRFVKNAQKLTRLGFETVRIDRIGFCRSAHRHVVWYGKIEGQTLKEVLQQTEHPESYLNSFIVFLVKLHHQGVLFRSLHFGNILVKDNGDFALIDIADLKVLPFRLTLNQRIRNWQHLYKYAFEKSCFDSVEGVDYLNQYADLCGLSAIQTRKLKAKLRGSCHQN